MNEPDRILPKIGVAVWVRKEGKVLLGRRSKQSGNNTWGPPGGHLEMNETLSEAAAREVREEAGLEITNIQFAGYIEDIHPEQGTHYIGLHFAADWVSGDPVPELIEFYNLEWFDWNSLPQPIFRPAKFFVEKNINILTI